MAQQPPPEMKDTFVLFEEIDEELARDAEHCGGFNGRQFCLIGYDVGGLAFVEAADEFGEKTQE